MRDVIKTIESWRAPRRVLEFLNGPPPGAGRFLFNAGRARPQEEVRRLYFVFRGRVLGWFAASVVENHGDYNSEYAHQFTPPYWKAARFLFACAPPFVFLKKQRIFHRGFQGWRYFDFQAYSKTLDAKVKL